MRQDHEPYMRQALALAEEAAAAGEVPVGCVIVDETGQVLGRGRNRREEDHDPLAQDAGFGACGSILNLFEENFRHHPKIIGHILEDECRQVLQDFFAGVRQKDMQT